MGNGWSGGDGGGRGGCWWEMGVMAGVGRAASVVVGDGVS